MISKVLLTGGTGLIGRALTQSLLRDGVQVMLLVRRAARPASSQLLTEVEWHPDQQPSLADAAVLEGCDGAVNLSGANVAERRWTPTYKQLILSSRVDTAHSLQRIFATLQAPPPVTVAASAIGYYGNRGDEILTEAAPPGEGFLADVCRAWEQATEPLSPRVVQLRFGVVLTARGGALPKLQKAFRMGFGGKLGNGRQWMSWSSLDDAVDAIRFALETPGLSGPCNTVSPFPVTNAEFTRTLGRLLHRPTFLRVPGFALRTLVGGMAQESLLASARCVPERLHAAGFQFSHERLEQALGEMI